MKSLICIALASVAGLTFPAAQAAQAQVFGRPPGNPLGTPALSPYLNLANRGNAAINYYGIVRPQQEFRRDYVQLQQELLATQSALTTTDPGVLQLTTGHASRFFNYGHYFPVTYPLLEGGSGAAISGLPIAPPIGTGSLGTGLYGNNTTLGRRTPGRGFGLALPIN